MTTSDDFDILLIHPETDPLYTRVVEILLAAREPAMPSLDAASGDPARFGDVLSTLDILPDITTGYRPDRVEMSPDVWRFITGTEAPQHHRTPTHARHGGQRGDKAARKRQKQARKANRSRK